MLESLKVVEISNGIITIDLSESDLKIIEHLLGVSYEDKESFSASFNSFVNDAIINYLKRFEDGK